MAIWYGSARKRGRRSIRRKIRATRSRLNFPRRTIANPVRF